MCGDFFFKVQRSVKNSGVSPSFWQPGTLPRCQPDFVVAGDFIGRQTEFLIVGASEKRQLFHVTAVSQGEKKGKKRRKEEKEEKKERKWIETGRKGEKKRRKRKGKEGRGEYEDSAGGCVGRFFFQSPEL